MKRVIRNYEKTIGTTRVIENFIILPKTLKNKKENKLVKRFLEKVKIEQKLIRILDPITEFPLYYRWKDVKWVDI